MGRIALISDIHGNLEALQRVLDDIAEAAPDQIVCLGDVVGYGPDPGPCVELVHEACDTVILGNHDDAILAACESDADQPLAEAIAHIGAFNSRASAALVMTRHVLEPHHLSIIRSWPDRALVDGVEARHANLSATSGPYRWTYVTNFVSAAASFQGMSTFFAAVGHSHVPSVYVCPLAAAPLPENIRAHPSPSMRLVHLPAACRAIVNPGSVGQPRDGNPDASWALLDTDAATFDVHRVTYDIEAVENKVRQAGLPALLADRLRIGA